MSSTTNNNSRNVASYKWVIDNFSNCLYEHTSSFGFNNDNETQFQLWINPSLTTNYWNDTCVSISIHLSKCNQATLKVKHRMSIVNTNGDKCNTQEGISIFKNSKYNAHYDILRDVLMDPALGMLVNDTLTIDCEIELANTSDDPKTKLGDHSAMSKHFESLLESSKHSDVVLAIGEKEFHVHKLVLSTRSPVFAAMFDHSDTKEAQEGRVEIVDVPLEAFELFLRYLYTDKIDSLDRFALELLAAANMYQMDCLKTICEQYLGSSSQITTDNVAQLLIYADLYRAEVLKYKCIDYIADNSDKVKATEGWKAVAKNADLLSLLFDKLSLKLTSK